MATSNAIRELNLRAEYNNNLLPNSSFFTETSTFNVTTGTGSYAPSENVKYNEYYSAFITSGSYNSNDFTFDFGDDLKVIAPATGTFIFSWRFNNINETVAFYVPFEYQIQVYRDGFLTDTINGQHVGDYTVNAKKWNTYCQSFYAESGEEINFKFIIKQDNTYPFSIMNFFMGGLKLEYDDRYLGVPSIYTLPMNYISTINDLNNLIYVENPNDLPEAVSGVRTLLDKTYLFTSNIDLNGDRLVLGENTTITGTSSELASITSTGLGVGIPLITSIYSAPIRNIAIKDVDTAVSFDGTTNPNNMALDWTGVNFVNVPKIGTIKKASNFIFDKGSFLNSKGIKFDGTIATVAFGNSLLSGDGSAGNIIEILPTCTITRRFRTIYSSIVATGSTIGVKVDALATIPLESYILDTVNFSGGGTYLSGVSVTDNKALFVQCKGISNSSEISQYYMNANATTTTISATNTPVKVLGTTTSASITQKFTNTNNRATYTGSFTRNFIVIATLSVESAANNQVGCYIAKNGSVLGQSEVYGTTSGTGRAENVTMQTIVELSTNDYIEIYVENATAISNVLVTNLNVIVR